MAPSSTTVPVAEIYAYDDSRARIDASYMLMERLPGRALSDLGPVPRQVLKVPHQEAATSDRDWLATSAGRISVISVGHWYDYESEMSPEFDLDWKKAYEQAAGQLEPKVILYDEPTSGLDPNQIVEIIAW